MKANKLVLSAFAYAIINQLVYSIGALADMAYYTDPANSALWSRLMMPPGGSPGPEFVLLSFSFAVVAGAIFAYAFTLTRHAFATRRTFKSPTFWNTGLKFGAFLFLVTSFTGVFSIYLMFAVPTGLALSWLVQGLAISLASGVAFARIYES